MISIPIATVGIGIFVFLILIAISAIITLTIEFLSGEQIRAVEAAKIALPVVAAAIGFPLLIWRLRILDKQTRISDAKAQIDRETHYTSIFSRSIDQLGQTREIKRTTETGSGPVDSTTTVPNIEVRLGGIHSLARLAEESSRDRGKIANVLRSYIRENSWSDKAGQIIDQAAWQRNAPWNWSYNFDVPPTADTIAARDSWIGEANLQIAKLREWAKPLSETRVDVNEAADALEDIVKQTNNAQRPFMYESIFVGRHFHRQFLAAIDFQRCTFVRCTFDTEGVTELRFQDSIILNSRIVGNNADIKLSDSKLWNVRFFGVASIIDLSSCDVYSVRIPGTPAKLSITDCSLFEFRVMGSSQNPSTMTLHFDESCLVNSYFRNLKVSSESNLNLLPTSLVSMDNVDLSELKLFSEEGLSSVKANSRTLHPKDLARPVGWRPYAPNDEGF